MRSTSSRRLKRPRPRVEALEGRALLAAVAGTPDSTFGGGTGYASISLGLPSLPSSTVSYGVADTSVITLADGNVVVSGLIFTYGLNGQQSSVVSISEFNADGSVDTGFGFGGQVQLPAQGSYATLALPSGQILVAEGLSTGTGSPTYAAVRLNANGALDTTFGTGGVAQYPVSTTTPTANRLDSVTSALLQANGQIVLVGASYGTESSLDVAAVRLNSDGSLDTSYGQDGTVNVPITVNGFTQAFAVGAAMQADGQVLVAAQVESGFVSDGMLGYTTYDIGVVRLTTDGTLDTTYGGASAGGIVLITPDLSNPTTTAETTPAGIAIDPTTGQALITGTTAGATNTALDGNLLYRLNTDGTLDTSFGAGGLVMPSEAGPVAVQANGQILVAASVYSTYPALLRLNADGTPDTTFGNVPTPGVFQPSIPTLNTIKALSIQPNGDILAAGTGTVPSLAGRFSSIAVARVLPTASTGTAAAPIPGAPVDLSAQGYTDAAVYDPTTGSFVFKSPVTAIPGGTVTQFGIAGVGQTIPAAADYLGLGYSQIGAYFPTYGIYAIRPTNGSTGLVMQFGMAGAGMSIPVPADYEGTGKADVAVYMPSIAAFAILPSDGSPGRIVPFGIVGVGQSIPAPADYYHTGQDDIAVYLSEIGAFAIQDPTGQTPGEIVPFGKPGLGQSIPVPGDYDGSGKTELAVYVPSLGAYFYRPADGGNDVMVPIGSANSGEMPVPGDYDGSGRTEVAIYDPTGGFIEYKPANGGPAVMIAIGTPTIGTIPVATPAGALPEYNTLPPGSASGIRPGAIVSSSSPSSTSGTTNAITLTKTSAVPAGPTLASVRVTRTLINQTTPDPLKKS